MYRAVVGLFASRAAPAVPPTQAWQATLQPRQGKTGQRQGHRQGSNVDGRRGVHRLRRYLGTLIGTHSYSPASPCRYLCIWQVICGFLFVPALKSRIFTCETLTANTTVTTAPLDFSNTASSSPIAPVLIGVALPHLDGPCSQSFFFVRTLVSRIRPPGTSTKPQI